MQKMKNKRRKFRSLLKTNYTNNKNKNIGEFWNVIGYGVKVEKVKDHNFFVQKM